MKSFFEEYGFVILAAIVVILLIAMASPIGDLVKIQVSEVVNSFGSKTQSKLNATDGIIQVRVSTNDNKITLEWDAIKKEDKFKYQYKASNTKDEANWTNVETINNGDNKTRKVEISTDSTGNALTNKTKVEYKIYDSNDQLVASGVVTAKVGKNATTGDEGGVSGGSTETTPTETLKTGKEIEIEGKSYTVIECSGTNCKVLAAPDTFQRRFDDNSNKYVNSEIANYLDNGYLDTLSENIRNAIVETSIQQKVASNLKTNNPTWTGEVKEAGTHKVFIPSWEEVTKVYGTKPEELKAYAPNGWTWLRDTFSSYVFRVSNYGNLLNDYPYYSYYVRPAFVLDLSKVDYTIK